jgi:hypothetical protein
MSTNKQRASLIRRAKDFMIISDGAYRWVGIKSEVSAWLREHGHTRLCHLTVTLDAESYQDLCDSTRCIVTTCGGAADYTGDPNELIEAIGDSGASTLDVL